MRAYLSGKLLKENNVSHAEEILATIAQFKAISAGMQRQTQRSLLIRGNH